MPPAARLSPSAHVDTFTRDHLPPAHLWPVIEFTRPELTYPDRLNAAADLVDLPAQTLGADRAALRTPQGETWTYGELRTRANQVAQVLTEDLGLVPGQRVLLRSPNNPWTVAAWLGVLKAGGVVVTTMAALRARELGPIAERTQPCVALVDHRFADDARAVRDTRAPSMTVISYGGDAPGDLTVLAAAKSGEFSNVATAADDVALLAPTSGSTGIPKITMHFHRDILSIDNTFGRHTLKLAPDDVVACTAPLAFTFGLGMLVVFALRAGACALLIEQATPAALAEIVSSEGVTTLATAPTAYKAILRDGLEGKLAGLRKAVSAGEHIPQGTWERLRDTHRPEGHRRHRRDRDAAHLHRRGGRRHQAGRDRTAGARLPRGHPRPGRQRTRSWRAGTPRRDRAGRLPLPGRRTAAELRVWRLERHRRRLLQGRRRLLLLPGAQRQHDRVLRLQHRRPRGGGRDRHAPRRP